MGTCRELEQQIEQVERFSVKLYNAAGNKVRADKGGFSDYPFTKAADGSLTLAAWIKVRFTPNYPDFALVAFDGEGNQVNGGKHLKNFRQRRTRTTAPAATVVLVEPIVATAPVEEPEEVDMEEPEKVEIPTPAMVMEQGTFPSLEVNVDRLPYIGSFEDTMFLAAQQWLADKGLRGPATIWKWRTESCNFGNGFMRSVYVVPFGFGAGFLSFLESLFRQAKVPVRAGEEMSPRRSAGWAGVCHVQDGKVFQICDAASWVEV